MSCRAGWRGRAAAEAQLRRCPRMHARSYGPGVLCTGGARPGRLVFKRLNGAACMTTHLPTSPTRAAMASRVSSTSCTSGCSLPCSVTIAAAARGALEGRRAAPLLSIDVRSEGAARPTANMPGWEAFAAGGADGSHLHACRPPRRKRWHAMKAPHQPHFPAFCSTLHLCPTLTQERTARGGSTEHGQHGGSAGRPVLQHCGHLLHRQGKSELSWTGGGPCPAPACCMWGAAAGGGCGGASASVGQRSAVCRCLLRPLCHTTTACAAGGPDRSLSQRLPQVRPAQPSSDKSAATFRASPAPLPTPPAPPPPPCPPAGTT